MLGYCSFSQPLVKQTLDPKPSIAPLCQHWRHTTILRVVIIAIICIITLNEIILLNTYYTYYDIYVHSLCIARWLKSVGSQILYELDHRKPVLYVIPIQNILGKLPVVPVGDTGTIPHHLRNVFPGAPGNRRTGAGDGCRMWFVNSWALGWSPDM